MAVSYNGLWKKLIDKDMKKVDLINNLGISSSTIAKMTKGEPVSLTILEKLCEELDCDFGDIISYDKSIGSGTRIDIGNWEHSLSMAAPRMFETNLYVETNLNATNILDKIKHLLDLCRIDAENLVVAYSMKDNENKEKVTDYKAFR